MPKTTGQTLARIMNRLCEGDLTDSEAAARAERVLAKAKTLHTDTEAAYWSGRLEEATGHALWPFDVDGDT